MANAILSTFVLVNQKIVCYCLTQNLSKKTFELQLNSNRVQLEIIVLQEQILACLQLFQLIF